MKKFLLIILIFIVLLFSQFNFAQDKVKVDYVSDFANLIKKGDTSVMEMIGNVYFYHNNAIISCDTAYYYYALNEFEGVGNVKINQDSMYIYGDRITYDETNGRAQVFSPLVKVVDFPTIMYTRNLIYNTKNAVAEYYDGATLEHNETILESEKGFYDSKNRIVMLRHEVEINNADYEVKTDSLDFYLDTEVLDFECRTYIWKENGDFLQADKGKYNKIKELFQCDENSYVMTEKQEVWADSISYYSMIDEIILKNNIQMLDTAKKIYAFGDYGQYWKLKENVLLTKDPSIVNYDINSIDTIYVSSDTLFIRPFIERGIIVDSTIIVSDSLKMVMDQQRKSIAIDTTIQTRFGGEIGVDGIEIKENNANNIELDTLNTDKNIIIDSVLSKEQNVIIDSLFQNEELLVDSLKIDSIAIDSLAVVVDSVIDIDNMTRKEYKEYKKKRRLEKKIARQERFLQWLRDGGMEVIIDTINLDTISNAIKDSIDSVKVDSILIDENVKIENLPDSSDYIIRGYLNSRVFRNDVQLICDSLITETVDSTTTLIGSPIMWNLNNQITSKRIRTYTKNGELYRARLFEKPILGQHVEDQYYNQIKGEYMDAMFRDGSIHRLYVNDASETIYYKQDETVDEFVEGLIFATSVNMIIDFDSTEISTIGYFTDIVSITYPINDVPEDQVTVLQGFEWKEEFRPKKKDVFDRIIRKSYREEANSIEKPYFRITKMISNMKKTLPVNSLWKDRVDLIPPPKRNRPQGIF